MSGAEFDLPDMRGGPDNAYADGQVISWNFTDNGHRATHGHIFANFDGVFPVADGGERITLHEPEEGATLRLVTLDDEGEERKDQDRTLREHGETVFIPPHRNVRIQTGEIAVKYICRYPGQPAEE